MEPFLFPPYPVIRNPRLLFLHPLLPCPETQIPEVGFPLCPELAAMPWLQPLSLLFPGCNLILPLQAEDYRPCPEETLPLPRPSRLCPIPRTCRNLHVSLVGSRY